MGARRIKRFIHGGNEGLRDLDHGGDITSFDEMGGNLIDDLVRER